MVLTRKRENTFSRCYEWPLHVGSCLKAHWRLFAAGTVTSWGVVRSFLVRYVWLRTLSYCNTITVLLLVTSPQPAQRWGLDVVVWQWGHYVNYDNPIHLLMSWLTLPARPFFSSLSASHHPPTSVSIPLILIHEAEFAAPQTNASAMPEQELHVGLGQQQGLVFCWRDTCQGTGEIYGHLPLKVIYCDFESASLSSSQGSHLQIWCHFLNIRGKWISLPLNSAARSPSGEVQRPWTARSVTFQRILCPGRKA